METIIALEGDGYVLMAADVASARSIVVMKDDMDKIRQLDENKLFAAAGVPGDVTKFSEHVQKDVRLYTLRSGITMSTAAVANYARGELARFLRRSTMQCNILIGGYDSHPNGNGPCLYSCDYLGTLTKLSFAAEGYAQYFVLSTLDRYWKKNLSLDDGLAVIRSCIAEVQKRLVINQPHFAIKIVTKDGVTVIDNATSSPSGSKADIDMTASTTAAPAAPVPSS